MFIELSNLLCICQRLANEQNNWNIPKEEPNGKNKYCDLL